MPMIKKMEKIAYAYLSLIFNLLACRKEKE